MSWRARLALGLGIMAVGGSVARAAATVEIAIVAPEKCPADLRERIAQQIAGLTEPVEWSCLPRFDQEDPFQPLAAGPRLRFWIDLTPETEARLTLRDGRSDRFLVRRVPLPRGLDEIGREELGQIVRSALLAMGAGTEETLTRAQARAEIARWPRPPAPPLATAPAAPPASARTPPPAAASAPPLKTAPVDGRQSTRPPLISLDFAGAFGAARAFAPSIPVVAEIGLGGEIVHPGPFGGWVEAGYQLPARYAATPLGVELSALAFRAGFRASRRLGSAMEGRLGAGGGLTRMSFAPQGTAAVAAVAPPATFWYGTARILAALERRLSTHVVAGVTAFVDVVGSNVHYDVAQPDGTTRRVLVPYRFQPGLALEIGWRR